MRTALTMMALCAGGCSWKIEDANWLPLLGSAPSLADAPQISGGFCREKLYRDAEGRIWFGDHAIGPFVATSFEIPPQRRELAAESSWTSDGVLSVVPLSTEDEKRRRYRIDLDPLTAPVVTHTVETWMPIGDPIICDFADCTLPSLQVSRGPGYFVYIDPSPSPEPSPAPAVHVLFDDGREDVIPRGDDFWTLIFRYFPGPFDHAKPTESAHYLLLVSPRLGETRLAVYDLEAHRLWPFGPIPRPQDLIYDRAAERLWLCGGEQTVVIPLATREERVLPISCFRVWTGAEPVVESLDGTLYLVGDGAPERLGQAAPLDFDVRAVRDRRFVYGVRTLFDEPSDGWLDDGRRIIHLGREVRFSADGTRLYWLDDVTTENLAGDLLSMELATGTVRHLVRNVKHWEELPDGRLVAIANAAIAGSWNRAIVVDERKSESRWLAEAAHEILVIGQQAICSQGARSNLVLLNP